MNGERREEGEVVRSFRQNNAYFRNGCILRIAGLGSSRDSRLELNIEPGLFEWLKWCRGVKPVPMCYDDLLKMGETTDHEKQEQNRFSGYPINLNYQQIYRDADLKMDESLQFYFQRSTAVAKKIVSRHKTGVCCVS